MAKHANATLDNMTYVRSDATFHYVRHNQFKTSTLYKVRRDRFAVPADVTPGEVLFSWRLREATTRPLE